MALTPKQKNYVVIGAVVIAAYIGFVVTRSLVNSYQVNQIKEQSLASAAKQ